MNADELPVAIIGGGPIGLTTALGLHHYGVPVMVFEEDGELSLDTKAGTVLTRTLEVLHRYGVIDDVLAASLRVDEIGEIDRATNVSSAGVHTGLLTEDTRYPFVVNIPQHHLEPVLRRAVDAADPTILRMGHRLTGFEQLDDRVVLQLDTPDGTQQVAARYLLACDGGRSGVRQQLGITVEGMTLAERYMLIDLRVDLDVGNQRDYPYLAYFGDPQEWMILIRQPHCWRFLFPLLAGAEEPTREELAERAVRFIGEVDGMEILGSNIYTVHHRVAEHWRDGRVFLMGDAAHLITPMWALGLNTGVLDASNLPWRLAFVYRGWATDALLDGYEREQAPLAIQGSGRMAEAARATMERRRDTVEAMTGGGWGVAITRTLLGVRLDIDGDGEWSLVKAGDAPVAVRVGDRCPDLPLFGALRPVYLHDLVDGCFAALWFTDVRRRPAVPADSVPGLAHFAVSRWDAPHDSGLRGQGLFDPGRRVQRRLGVADDTVVLVRPDGHIAAIRAFDPADLVDEITPLFRRVVGMGTDTTATRIDTATVSPGGIR